jgi:hypothetical protein
VSIAAMKKDSVEIKTILIGNVGKANDERPSVAEKNKMI